MRHDAVLHTTQRANRRRLQVFLGTLVAALLIGLAFTWLRPAEYRASARLEITPGAGSTAVAGSTSSGSVAGPASESARPFLTEVQILTSRPVLEVAAKRLEGAGHRLSESGFRTVADMQARLQAITVPNTNVVELVATGPRPEILAPLIAEIIDVYRNRLADVFHESSTESLAQVEEEVKKLKDNVASKRREVEAFRQRHNIVSPERDENQILAHTRGLSSSLATANENVAKAEGRLRALTDSVAAGSPVVRAKDESTLGNLEQRASQLREQLSELARDFTPAYLAVDPKAIAIRSRLADSERQIAALRESSQRSALADAREELANAQAIASRIQSQIATGQKDLGQFTSRFNEFKSQQEQLGAVESAYKDASRRLALQEATLRARTPALQVLEPATQPQEPIRPHYWRDTGVAIAASLILALLVMWLVELFNRSEPRPGVVVVQPPSGMLPDAPPAHALGWQGARALPLDARGQTLLPRQSALPRELTEGEVAALVNASDDESKLVVLLLLSGVDLDEALALRWADVDLAGNRIHIGGRSPRDVSIHESLRALLAARMATPGPEGVLDRPDRPASLESVHAQLLYGAHDAGIENAMDVTAECLRHTYVAFLVRQGMRFADLVRLVGHLPAEVLGAYSALSPGGARVSGAQINVVFPVNS